jgi:hypothetical protein
MKKLICGSVVTVALFLGSLAYAAGWSGIVGVSKISVEDTGSGAKVFINFASTPLSTGCSNAGVNYWLLSGTSDDIKRMLSVALAAKQSVNNVKVYWNGGCSGGGSTGYPIATGLELQ